MPATAAALETQTPADLATARQKVLDLLADMTAQFFERDIEALLLLLAIISEEHVLLLGPPGTAKTNMAEEFADALGVPQDKLFKYLLGKFTMPDEIFGPVDLPAMKQGTTRRITTRKLPEAIVAVLDECFKANSSILNSLLTMVNERAYDNPTRMPVPLEMVVGMSNELPEGGPQGPLGALYDRFLFRKWTKYIEDEDDWCTLMLATAAPTLTTSLTAADLQVLRDARRAVRLDGMTSLTDDKTEQPLPLVRVVWHKIKAVLESEHGIVVSDRRWRKAMKAVQAHAVLHGRTVATVADLAPLAHVLWDEPEEAAVVAGIIDGIADADMAKARSLHAAAVALVANLPDSKSPGWSDAAGEVSRKIKDMEAEIRALPQQTDETEKLADQCAGYCEELLRKSMNNFGL